MFRTLRLLSAILLVGSVFVTTDLAINLAGALVPELQVDGIPFSLGSISTACASALASPLKTASKT